ncbi:hypothetical protein Prudu_005456 [Prunus dulcis]|uniref:RNase H type-1 domain-containing protein n=1 Tax=Prunus dulcis TaxID=3755 RepID=A0A4Y1QXM3_PRUDU|nr:hypothetical protein Prudu_005456 [Prunus dulcis]
MNAPSTAGPETGPDRSASTPDAPTKTCPFSPSETTNSSRELDWFEPELARRRAAASAANSVIEGRLAKILVESLERGPLRFPEIPGRVLSVGQVLEAELWGIYLGMKIAWDIGCSAVVLESDSATAVHLLNKNVEDFHPLATMLWGCQDYINKVWVCQLSRTLLTVLGPFLSEDLLGVCRPRAIV